MAGGNLPTLAEVQADGEVVRALPMEVLHLLLEECDATRKTAEAAKRALVAHLGERLAGQIGGAFSLAGKDYGTVHVEAEGFDVEVTRDKKVEWDQAGLAALALAIQGGGEDPADYVKTELKVEERKYAAFTPRVRAAFDAHRTTKPASTTIKLTAL